MLKFCQWTKLYGFYRFLVRVPSWKKIDKVFFFSSLNIRTIGTGLKKLCWWKFLLLLLWLLFALSYMSW